MNYKESMIANQITKENSEALPKVKPYLAIKALLTMMIPTEVTILNNHAPASRVAFLSPLLEEVIVRNRNQVDASATLPPIPT